MTDSIFVANENAMLLLGEKLASIITAPAVIFLHGDLGAGKSTLVRGFMKGLGYQGRVKSPTFTLVEPYEVEENTIYHMDLYRLADPEELEFIGIRDIVSDNSICLIEWPEKAGNMLINPTINIYINYLESGRTVRIVAVDPAFQSPINEL